MAMRQAQRAAMQREATEREAIVKADQTARQRELDARDGRTLEQKMDITVEWDRQQALSRMQKGTQAAHTMAPHMFGARSVPRSKPAGEWAVVV